MWAALWRRLAALCQPTRAINSPSGAGRRKDHMTSKIESDGKTVIVTTCEGHRIGFAMAELNAPSTSGEITTGWANGVPPQSAERTVADSNL